MLSDHGEECEAINAIGTLTLDAAFKIHRQFGPGLLEGAYEALLTHELQRKGLKVDRQLVLPIMFEGGRIDLGYRLDLLVEDKVIIEIKAVDKLAPVHEAQLLTYLNLSSRRLGYLINFNVATLKDGIRRKVL